MSGHAALIVALSATMSPDVEERVIASLYVATHFASLKREPWWRWTSWLAFGITHVRMQYALKRVSP